MPSIVAQHQNENAVITKPEQKMMGKPPQVHTAQSAGDKVEALWVHDHRMNAQHELLVEFISKPGS